MLSSLRIENLALIDSAQLNFCTGLSVLTGESGSGKSILLDALALVTGCSRPRIKTRTGAASGFVEAEFHPALDSDGQLSSLELKSALVEQGLFEACSSPGEPIILARRVDASGRTRCFIQGQTVTRAVLAHVGSCLIELCGQSEAHSLRTPAAQLAALDRFAHLGPRARRVSRLVQVFKQREAEEQRLELMSAEAERRRDFLEFQLNELDELDLSGLDERRARLEQLLEETASLPMHRELIDELEETDHALVPRLRRLSSRLSNRLRVDPRGLLSATVGQLDAVASSLDEVVRSSISFVSDFDRAQEEVAELEEQFSSLKNLARKHRISVEELPARRIELKAELDACTELNESAQKARAQTEAARREAEAAAEDLHLARVGAARQLDSVICDELERVGLSGARFESRPKRVDLSVHGVTEVEFFFSANPGHEPEPLSRVASGGELSRVLLCFRLATESSGAMLVFDEIDAGAGGKTAEKIAQSLGRAAAAGQVLCVTHWPQVAGAADVQFSVTKQLIDGVARASVRIVSGEERVREISRMLGGAEETAREHACGLVRDPAERSSVPPSERAIDRRPEPRPSLREGRGRAPRINRVARAQARA